MKLKLGSCLTAGRAFIKSYYNYFQYLFTDNPNELVGNEYTNYGWGGSDVNGLVLSGSIAGEDLEMDWTRGNAGLTALSNSYGIPNPITYTEMKGLNGYSFPLNVKQAFLKQSPVLEGSNLKDYSNTPINATIKAGYYNGVGQPTGSIPITTPIVVNLYSEGLKFELCTSLDPSSTVTRVVSSTDGWVYAVTILTTTCYIQILKDDGITNAQIAFPLLGLANNNTFALYKFVVDNNKVMTGYKTTPDDVNYVNAITQTFDMKTITGFDGIQVYSAIGSPSSRIKGKLKFINIGGQRFSFESGAGSSYIISQNSANSLNFTNYQYLLDTYDNTAPIESIHGYTLLIFIRLGLLNYSIIPYLNGASCINCALAALVSIGGTNAAYEEYPNGEFGHGWAYFLDSSMQPYDINNTYFTASVANPIRANNQPDSLGNKIFYDRQNNKNIVIYDTEVNLNNYFNFKSSRFLIVADSTGTYKWKDIMQYKTGIQFDSAAYPGETTAEIQASLTTQLAGDTTLITRQDVIIVQCTFNDWGRGNNSYAQLTIDYQNLINYIRNQDANVPIIMAGIYNFDPNINEPPIEIDDGNTPNGLGLTMSQCREIVQNIANATNNAIYVDLNSYGFTVEDLPDGIHTSSVKGMLKLANIYINTMYQLSSGGVPVVIPTTDFSFDNQNIKGWNANPYYSNGIETSDNKVLYTNDNKLITPIKDF